MFVSNLPVEPATTAAEAIKKAKGAKTIDDFIVNKLLDIKRLLLYTDFVVSELSSC